MIIMVIMIIQKNLRSSIICCLFSGGMYISSGFSFSFDLPIEVILSAMLFPIKSPLASAVFCTTLLEAVFAASIPIFVAVSIHFLPYLSPNLLAKDKKPYALTYFLNFGSVEYLIYIIFIQKLVQDLHYLQSQMLY